MRDKEEYLLKGEVPQEIIDWYVKQKEE